MNGKYSITGNARTRNVFIEGIKLSPAQSLKVLNKSPDGFAWGYAGSGPSQLALAILLALTGDEKFAKEHYQDFKSSYITKLPIDEDFELDINEVNNWIAGQRG
jgi:hypothetical protein